MKLRNIKIQDEIWWTLNKLKVEWRVKTLSDVITKLVRERKK